jgi:signal transduction histidine kinase
MSAQSAQAMVISDEDIRQMDSLADQAANVMQTLRLIEQQQETVERLQEVDRLKQQFLANMSHELRTPLNSIIGYSEVLLDGVDGDLTEDAEEDVEAIHDSGKHLLSIINEILDLAKIEAGQMQLDPQDVDLPQFIKDIVHSGQILVKDKDVALEWVEQSAVPVIQADPIRVRQVLWNLISNAVKFTEAGGVTVTYGMHSDTEVFVRVQDTGIGMNEEGLATIFQRFSQVDGSSTRRAGGTGLGLTITRQLVRMHGGDVYVESEVGVGSTFWFTLPVEIIEKA